MKLEYANLICPRCRSGNYMRHLVGKNVGALNVKCINCNSYFKLSDFGLKSNDQARQGLTNADRTRKMDNEALADLCASPCPPNQPCGRNMVGPLPECRECWKQWLESEAEG